MHREAKSKQRPDENTNELCQNIDQDTNFLHQESVTKNETWCNGWLDQNITEDFQNDMEVDHTNITYDLLVKKLKI